MSDTSALYRLQEIDTTWDKVRRRLLQLQNLSGGSEELKAVREQTHTTESSLQEWQRTQQDAELESRSLASKIQESEALLMGGQVRNPKELESLQASIEALRRHKDSVEDRGVEALMQVEALSGALAEQKSTLSTLEADWQAKQQAIDGELQQRKREYVYLKRLREQTQEKIDDGLLEQYEHLRKRKHNVAVAKLDGDVCGACHMQVPRGIIGEARRDNSLTFCPGCGRILYAG